MSFFLNSFNFKVIVPSVGTGFVIQIDTTKAGSTTSTQFNLALRSSTNYDFNIDWGDGVIESYTSSNTTGYTHTYPSSGIYTVSIGERTVGGFPRVYYNNTGDRLKLLKIAAFGSNQFGTDWNNSFNGCNNLVITATDGSTAKTNNITNFVSVWANCTSLTSFPLIDTSNGTNFDNAWNGCDKLKDFPLIDTSKTTSLDRTWAGCTSLTAFPLINTTKITSYNRPWQLCRGLLSFPLIDTLSATNLTNTWENCEKLTTFPLINTSNVIYFNTTWSQCISLSSFPLIDTSKATTLFAAWQLCSKLNSFPLINTSNVISFNTTWSQCISLNSFPLLNTSNVTDFSYAWRNCTSLSSFPLIDTSKGTNFSATWQNCTSLSSFPLIDTSKGTNFLYAWQNCTSLISFPLIDTSKGTNFFGAWWNCSLSSFPNLDFFSDRTWDPHAFRVTWQNCTSLVNFNPKIKHLPSNPLSLFTDTWAGCSKLTNMPCITALGVFQRSWSNCTSLSSFDSPSILYMNGDSYSGNTPTRAFENCYLLTNLPTLITSGTDSLGENASNGGTFTNCRSLTSFPFIDTSNVKYFYGTWSGCISLSASDFPTLNMSKMTNGTSCFQGVKLTTTSYSSLLTSLCATNFNTLVNFHGGNSTYNTPASAARAFLTTSVVNGGRGWTITDGGYQTGT